MKLMNKPTIGFLGAGRITRIFLGGWTRNGVLPKRIVVSDCNAETLTRLKEQFPSIEIAPENRLAAAAQDVVFLAVHPPVMPEVAGGIKGALRPDALVVSLAPKFTMARLTDLLGGFTRLARVIPNAPSVVNFGYNPVAFGPALTAPEKAVVTNLLAPLGKCPEVAEAKLEGYALLTGMGPTYLWFQLQALREVATGFGLSEEEMAPAIKHMVGGTAHTLLDSGLTPGEVMDLIPVKPLAEMEPQINAMYHTRLPALYQKIKP